MRTDNDFRLFLYWIPLVERGAVLHSSYPLSQRHRADVEEGRLRALGWNAWIERGYARPEDQVMPEDSDAPEQLPLF